MTKAIENILGPRVPPGELRVHTARYLLPTVLLLVAAGLLAWSFTQPYWSMTLHAPQYPKGLHVQAHLNRLSGDVAEIDGLNHYIGMRPLGDAAQFERQTSAMMIAVVAALLLAAIFIHNRWAALVAVPGLLFPLGFLADLQYWLASFGTNLDPRAALSSSIKPFVPPVLGVGTIGQFKTVAEPGTGFWMATAASVIVLAALYFHRRAYKPLVERRKAAVAAPRLTAAVAVLGLLVGLPSRARADGDGPRQDLKQLFSTAAPGATVRVPAGVYGALVVDKPLTLIADGRVTIDAGGVGDAVQINAADVTLRGFHIRGTGDSLDRQNTGILVRGPRAVIEDNTLDDVLMGISLSGAASAQVRRNHIHGKALDLSRRGDAIRLWSSDGAVVEDNVVEAGRDVVVWYSRGVRLSGNTVRDSRYGLHFMYANDGVVEGNRLIDNSVGVFLMYSRGVLLRNNVLEHNRGPSGYGIGLKDMDGVIAEGNTIVANRVGLYVDNSPSRIDGLQEFRRNVFAFNDVGLAFLPAVQRNRFTENEFHENLEQVAILGTGELKNNDFTVAGRGNFWSDYAGFDADGDGVGDVRYRALSLFENLIDREPKLRLLLYSPAQQAIELASRAFPIVRPQPKITDAAPLMRPVADASSAQPRQAAVAWPLSSLAAGLIGLAALLTGGIRRSVGADQNAQRKQAPLRNALIAGHARDRALAGASRPDLPVPPAAGVVLQTSALTKTFGRQVAVDGLTLDVRAGQAVALWGANGAGKTTIIKCLLGLHRFDGAVRIAGRDVRRNGKAARRRIGYVSQELSFYDDLSALETTRFFAALKRVPRSRAGEALVQVELAEHAHKRVAQLSGGMKQRLALAVALLADPPVLLLDEPTSNLDAAARRSFFELLRELKAAGKTIVFTTHRSEEVLGLADRVIVLERGRVLRDIPAKAFSASCQVRMRLDDEEREPARRLLRAAGFDAKREGDALLMCVPVGHNADPITILTRAAFAVRSIEIEPGDQA